MTQSPPPTCIVDGCEVRVRLRVELDGKRVGMCNTHARRTQRYGSPFVIRKRPSGPCEVEGCGERARRWGLCAPHSEQQRTHGDPLVRVRASPGSGTTRKDGYRQVHAEGHPLADSRGLVLEHRKMLYDAIGPGEHPCHRCGTPVSWQKGITPTSLIADHADFDRANNDLANLLVSCNRCNVQRTQLDAAQRAARSQKALAARWQSHQSRK